MLEHWGDKAKIIHFSCDLRKRRSEGLTDNFTWRELEISGEEEVSGLVSRIKTQWERGSGRDSVRLQALIRVTQSKEALLLL